MDSPTRPAYVYTFDLTTNALRSELMRVPGGCDAPSGPPLVCRHSTLPTMGEDTAQGLSIHEVRLPRRDFVYFLERNSHTGSGAPRSRRQKERKRETRRAKKVVRAVELLARRLEAEMSAVTDTFSSPSLLGNQEGGDLGSVEGEGLKRDGEAEFCICGASNLADGGADADGSSKDSGARRTSCGDASSDIDMLWAHREVALLIKDVGDCMDALDLGFHSQGPPSAVNAEANGCAAASRTTRHEITTPGPFPIREVPTSQVHPVSEVEPVPEDYDDKAVLEVQAADVEREPDRTALPQAGSLKIDANAVLALNVPELSGGNKSRCGQRTRRSRTATRVTSGRIRTDPRTRAGRKARVQALGTSAT
ncbi:hypothetical protein C8Q78DRAFT_989389 [Trametes maxima]|nr:hypothetical protein C8Q78DRAFT_989389 [Trametes maxima]